MKYYFGSIIICSLILISGCGKSEIEQKKEELRRDAEILKRKLDSTQAKIDSAKREYDSLELNIKKQSHEIDSMMKKINPLKKIN